MNESRSLDQLYVILDLDRTLLDTEALNDGYQSVVRQLDSSLADALMHEKRETEDSGGTFDFHQFLHKQLSDEQVERFDEHVIEQLQSRSITNDGALELLQHLAERQIAHGILTYGSNSWQLLKLRACGLDRLPYSITSDSKKSRVIRSWQGSGGVFHLPHELVAQEMGAHDTFDALMLVDDKAVSFDDLPMNVTGVWYKPSENLLKSQQGAVPKDVITVRHLSEVIEILGRLHLA